MRSVFVVLGKDLRVLRRSPLLVAALVAYPLTIALLAALVAAYSDAKPRVAFVDEDGLPSTVEIAGQRFDVERTIERVSGDVDLVRLDDEEAEADLARGRVVAVLTVPPGFVSSLRTLSTSPELRLQTTRGPLAAQVTQQAQALVYSLNRQLQDAYIDANLDYIEALEDGGTVEFGGQRFDVLGLAGVERALADLPPTPQVTELRGFVDTGAQALDFADEVLRATANPIELTITGVGDRASNAAAQLEAYALALTVAFLALVLAAGSLAAERDENVLSRLTRGLVGRGQLVVAKIALGALAATAVGAVVALAFAVAVELGEGSAPWERLPLVALALVLAGAVVAALGTLLAVLAREVRVAALAAVLVVVPVIFLALAPPEVAPPAAWISTVLPFVHAVRLFDLFLFDARPWARAAIEALWLGGLGLVFATGARVGMRRLSA